MKREGLVTRERVTRILDLCGMRSAWPDHIDEAQRAFFLERGSAIHAACAILDEGRQIDASTLDQRIEPYVDAWRRFRRETGGVIVAVEIEVISDRWNYVGHLDVVIKGCAIAPRHTLLLDRKTTEAAPETRLQTMAYRDAWEETLWRNGKRVPPRIMRGAIGLGKDRRWRFDPYTEDVVDREAWQACLTLLRWRQRNGLTE